MSLEFETFRKIPRLSRQCVITEKIDGTNGQIVVTEDLKFYVGSRSRWLVTPDDESLSSDNFGFGRWALEHKEELIKGLGIGRHYGEWWGAGIQRKYGLKEKRFSLFNTSIWSDAAVRPACCHVVPVLYTGLFETGVAEKCVEDLREYGSVASPGFMKPEGIVIYHVAAQQYFKKTLEHDEQPKGMVGNE